MPTTTNSTKNSITGHKRRFSTIDATNDDDTPPLKKIKLMKEEMNIVHNKLKKEKIY